MLSDLASALGFFSMNLFPSATAILVILSAGLVCFGCQKCKRLRLRDCCCCRWCMRTCNIDKFDDFTITIIVHDLSSLESLQDIKLSVSATSDRNVKATTKQKKGVWEESFELEVEQGVRQLKFEVLNQSDTAWAVLMIDPYREILAQKNIYMKTYRMQQLHKQIRSPHLKLSIFVEGADEGPDDDLESNKHKEVKAIKRLEEEGMSAALRANLHQAAHESAQSAGPADNRSKLQMELDLLAKSTSGKLKYSQGMFGRMKEVFVDVVGPPHHPRWSFRIFADEENRSPMFEIDLLRFIGISQDPVRENYFAIKYQDKEKNILVYAFERVDRGRDVWVEQLDLLVAKVRHLKDKRKGDAVDGKREASKKRGEEKKSGTRKR